MKIQRSNTILYCKAWTVTVDFYRDVFNFQITHHTDWFVEFQLAPHVYLSVADESHATIQSVAGQGITLSWQVADVHQSRTYLIERNVSVTDIKTKWGALVCYLHDPEGHRIELWQPQG